MVVRIAAILALAFIVASCGGETQKAMEAVENMKNIAENADDASKAMDENEKLRQERIKRGDTIAIPYEDLKKYLPSNVSGYTAGDPEGQSVDMAGMSYSTVSRDFTKTSGERIKVTIMDYNGSAAGYGAATAWFALNIKMDNEQEKAGTFQTDNPRIVGYQRVGKKDGNSTLQYGIAGRFYVTVEGSQQNGIDDVKAAAQGVNMAELANH